MDTKQKDWTRPAAMAIPKGGYFGDKVEQGRYGPIFPRTPAGYGFSVVAKIIPGREEAFYKHAKSIEETIAAQPDALAPCSCITCAGCSSPSRGRPTYVSGHFGYRRCAQWLTVRVNIPL
jgi:hypothetical protein